ncbi:MoxR family ATPase [Cohnella sp. GbtcB17]|uniref:AAA family ATPase n=1 Tax=Cohnella sp. GbtcB17 TaxID=2824762 RepID=UPI001C304B21|nr:MoxR family ATPase [Cohnella sp. GbtcB17]
MLHLEDVREKTRRVLDQIAAIVVGKPDAAEYALIALLASGHIILEDVPGTGKTLLAKSLARSLGCAFKRIQFTADLLPSDVSGINFYNQREGVFELRKGPVFTNILLADELNRATPRTQSSLLESMEERQVTIDGETYPLGRPFLVIATQNPVESHGTFPLPEAQLDRFMLRIPMGYPASGEEAEILRRFMSSDPLATAEPVLALDEVVQLQGALQNVRCHDDVLQYMLAIVSATRDSEDTAVGASPRASLQFMRAAQARALLRGRDFVLPEDIKTLAVPVLAHRLVLHDPLAGSGRAEAIVREIVNGIAVPAEQDAVYA